MAHEGPGLTALLRSVAEGDSAALDQVFARLYDELHGIARAHRHGWHGDETLSATALLHEAYLKLRAGARPTASHRAHFLSLASRVMRQVLVNYGERQRAAKRGGQRERVPVAAAASLPDGSDPTDEAAALTAALDRLERLEPRQARVVELRFLLGLPVTEAADALGVSPATVKRDWALASAWLHRELQRAGAGGASAVRDPGE